MDIRDIEKKEKMVEQSLKETVKSREQNMAKPKPAIDDSILNDSSKKKDSTFKPVE